MSYLAWYENCIIWSREIPKIRYLLNPLMQTTALRLKVLQIAISIPAPLFGHGQKKNTTRFHSLFTLSLLHTQNPIGLENKGFPPPPSNNIKPNRTKPNRTCWMYFINSSNFVESDKNQLSRGLIVCLSRILPAGYTLHSTHKPFRYDWPPLVQAAVPYNFWCLYP